jgi:hypothetical protein
MLTANECRTMANTCTKWAVESEAIEARKAFLALARDWNMQRLYLIDMLMITTANLAPCSTFEPHLGQR